MFKRLLSKVLGKPLGAAADAIITDKLDQATSGAASAVEKIVSKSRKKNSD